MSVRTYCATCKAWHREGAEHVHLGGPDDGHLWTITASSVMSSRVVGEPHHSDADHDGPAKVLQVRAWNQRDALRQAAERPLSAWRWADREDEEADDG